MKPFTARLMAWPSLRPCCAGRRAGAGRRVGVAVEVEAGRAQAVLGGGDAHEAGQGRLAIAAQANNPLKFSPSVEVALDHLLGTGVMRGFMGPTEAMRDAYTDLRAHEFGVMVGMRAALHDDAVMHWPVTRERFDGGEVGG